MVPDALRFSPRITALPILHGSGDFALEVRRMMLRESFDCLAVPLPPSFQPDVERAVALLPSVTVVGQPDRGRYHTTWQGHRAADDDAPEPELSYVPVDPCQGVIMALRIAMQERIPRAFVDLETRRFEAYAAAFPDPYALKQVPPERFAAAVLAALPALPPGQPRDRAAAQAARLARLEQRFESILFVCNLLDWPWVRDAYRRRLPEPGGDDVEATALCRVDPATLTFVLGELPFITGLYEQARAALEDDENLSVDGVKDMLLAARARYQADYKSRARKLPPQALALYLKYVRNLTLQHRRLTPDLYTLAVAAQQIAGDGFAMHLIETSRDYPYAPPPAGAAIAFGIGRARLSDPEGLGEIVVRPVNRLGGHPLTWGKLELKPRPPRIDQQRWRMRWDPFRSCSWPPEDVKIEQFRTHVLDAAQSLMTASLARSEKFTASLLDGIDIRETLRNWHTGDLYVKTLPPDRGRLDCVVMLFDSSADPREYPWRCTWQAEHEKESTLAFFATNYLANLVGPGIGLATYGGAVFLFPPRPLPEVWTDPRLDFADTLEERMLAAACLHSTSRHIALLAPGPPGAAWRKIAKHFSKRWVHLPLSRFSASTVQQLRMVHVLNGKQVRSFAAHFIRKS